MSDERAARPCAECGGMVPWTSQRARHNIRWFCNQRCWKAYLRTEVEAQIMGRAAEVARWWTQEQFDKWVKDARANIDHPHVWQELQIDE